MPHRRDAVCWTGTEFGSRGHVIPPDDHDEVSAVFSIRNLGGFALLVLGSTWLWTTPAFASRGVDTGGVLWTLARAGSLLTVLAFTLATVGLFARAGWWEAVALGAAGLGLLTLLPYGVAASRSGEFTPWWNVTVHVIGVAGVGVLLLVPPLEAWVSRHVAAG
ncbi:MAG: hypothetical protein ACRCXL_05620 [Dermatophilaceae bacterium]